MPDILISNCHAGRRAGISADSLNLRRRKTMFQKPYLNFIFSLAVVLITYLLCGWFNRVGMQNFYADIQKSTLTPPNYVFPIVWTILYVLMILAFDLILNIHDKNIKPAVTVFLINLAMQIVWTYAFFYQARFLAGLIIIVLLIITAVCLFYSFRHLSKTAAYLMIPYILWLLFAAYLNWAVVSLNGASYILP